MVVQTGRVETEGDELYYEVRGEGQPLLLIPGARGDAWWYSSLADILSDEFRVITYDRRANSRSTMNTPQNFDICQQSRDVVAVLHAVGETSAFIFGNSSGAVIALDMAKTHPQAIRAVVAHEPPVARVHPKAKKWQRFFAGVYWIAFRFGVAFALLRFSLGVGTDLPMRQLITAAKQRRADREKDHEPYLESGVISNFFVKQELLPVTNYLPDVDEIRKNEVRVFMAVGKLSRDKKRFYADTAQVLSENLGCELVIFPGHHISFFDMADEFAATLRGVLHRVKA